jgi:hypothetical protein
MRWRKGREGGRREKEGGEEESIKMKNLNAHYQKSVHNIILINYL